MSHDNSSNSSGGGGNIESPFVRKLRAMEAASLAEAQVKGISLVQTFRTLQVSEWVDTVSAWERMIHPEEVKKNRLQFLERVREMMTPEAQTRTYLKRWNDGQFTSIVGNLMKMDWVWIHGNPGNLAHKPEIEIQVEVHEKKMTMQSLQSMTWGQSQTADTMYGVRGIVPGTMFEKKGHQLVGLDQEVPEDFPVKKGVAYGDTIFILEPYHLPGFSYGGLVFERHPFMSPTQYSKERKPWYAGVEILTGETTYVSQYLPTVLTVVKGEMWECAYRGELIRVRPHTVGKPMALANLFSYVAPKPILMKDHLPYVLEEVVNGPFSVSFRSSNTRLYVDSGYRMCAERKYPCLIQDIHTISDGSKELHSVIGGVTHYSNAEIKDFRREKHYGKIVDQVIGAKVALISYDGTRVYISCEKEKLDYFGGKLELGETPMEALQRELKEECDLEIPRGLIVPLGYTDEKFEGTYYRSYMFLAMAEPKGINVKRYLINDWPLGGGEFVRWFPRLTRHFFNGRTTLMLVDVMNLHIGQSNGLLSDVHRVLKDEVSVEYSRILRMIQIRDPNATAGAISELLGSWHIAVVKGRCQFVRGVHFSYSIEGTSHSHNGDYWDSVSREKDDE